MGEKQETSAWKEKMKEDLQRVEVLLEREKLILAQEVAYEKRHKKLVDDVKAYMTYLEEYRELRQKEEDKRLTEAKREAEKKKKIMSVELLQETEKINKDELEKVTYSKLNQLQAQQGQNEKNRERIKRTQEKIIELENKKIIIKALFNSSQMKNKEEKKDTYLESLLKKIKKREDVTLSEVISEEALYDLLVKQQWVEKPTFENMSYEEFMQVTSRDRLDTQIEEIAYELFNERHWSKKENAPESREFVTQIPVGYITELPNSEEELKHPLQAFIKQKALEEKKRIRNIEKVTIKMDKMIKEGKEEYFVKEIGVEVQSPLKYKQEQISAIRKEELFLLNIQNEIVKEIEKRSRG